VSGRWRVEHEISGLAGDNPADPLFPSAHEIAARTGDAGQLSQQFYAILVAAGMAKERSHAETGGGRSRRRTVSEISFHSLRHCDLCQTTAPAFFTRDDEIGFSIVHRQPVTPEELALAEEAREGCPTESIGNDGNSA